MLDSSCRGYWQSIRGAFRYSGSSVILLVVCGLEINSVFMNYFEARGKKVKVNIFKYFAKKTDIIDVEEK